MAKKKLVVEENPNLDQADNSKIPVRYVPPEPEVVHKIAHAVCERMAVSDPSYNQPEIIFGLAAFLNVMARMHATHLNKVASKEDSRALDRKQ